tara:strand:- start:2592 stop:3803 length:1212 start_codon:yes stop_codon:yes gene_type:complete
MIVPNITEFIKKYVTKRTKSFFYEDLIKNQDILSKEIGGSSILVIGGAGTIGSNFIKVALRYKPSSLIVVDNNENGLTELTRTLRSSNDIIIPKIYITYPISFNSTVFYKVIENFGKFDIVANFAAHKHVRSEKDSYSIEAMLKNNVFYANKLLKYLIKNKPSHFFCVSTDKAANPVNVMGASKKIMEDLIISYSNDFKVTTARFANVAFSNGSLLDGFIKRFFQSQPISCPSDVKRFFVSPEESGEICLLTCILGKTGQIYYPKLDEKDMVNFKEITESFFEFIGVKIKKCSSENEAKKIAVNLKKDSPYPVYFFKTDTSGEKLFEEFYCKDDNIVLNKFHSIGIINNNHNRGKKKIQAFIIEVKALFETKNYNKLDIINIFKKYINNFNHSETGKYLDQKM